MKNTIRILSTGLGVASALLLSMSTAQATPMYVTGSNGLEIDLGGTACIAASCADLATAGYTVSGGAVLTDTLSGYGKKPGADTGNAGAVSSFNVTSSKDTPTGAIDPITVTGLNGNFSFYWGSIDSYNLVEFFLGDALYFSFNGTDLASLLGTSSSPNYDTDQYVTFSATGPARLTRISTFDSVKLSSANGVAFEVAAAVPEPGTLALLTLGLVGVGVGSQRRKQA